MKCTEFRNLYSTFVETPTREDRLTDKYFSWIRHMNNCEACGDWYQLQQVKSHGVNPEKYPCIHLAYYSLLDCETHKDAWECADTMLVRVRNKFGIPVRDGGNSFVEIKFCPWCGISLGKKVSPA